MVDERPDAAGELLSRLEDQAQEAVVNVRRLVQGLRPPALDDLGLVAAIRQQAEAYGMTEGAADVRGPGISLRVEAPGPVPRVPGTAKPREIIQSARLSRGPSTASNRTLRILAMLGVLDRAREASLGRDRK